MTDEIARRMQNEIDELRADNRRKANIIYVLNKLVLDLQRVASERHSCVLPRRSYD